MCLDFYISTETALGIWKGDNRLPDADAPASASRVQVVAGPDGARVVGKPTSCFVSGRCVESSVAVQFTRGDDGGFTVGVVATNEARVLGIPNPSINASVTFTPNGSGGYTTSGLRDPYPTLAVYQRQHGQWFSIPGAFRSQSRLGGLGLVPIIGPRDRW